MEAGIEMGNTDFPIAPLASTLEKGKRKVGQHTWYYNSNGPTKKMLQKWQKMKNLE